MIEKQRLETLIKEGAVIWSSRFNKADKIKLYQDYDIYKNQLCTYNKNHTFLDGRIRLNKLHESKEQAQWHIDNTFERVERLELPTFEGFCKLVNEDIRFYRNEYTYILQSCYYESGEETIQLSERYYDYGNILFEEPLTKENYKKVCKLCGKLFKGEEV